jgi:hypothetical protein
VCWELKKFGFEISLLNVLFLCSRLVSTGCKKSTNKVGLLSMELLGEHLRAQVRSEK